MMRVVTCVHGRWMDVATTYPLSLRHLSLSASVAWDKPTETYVVSKHTYIGSLSFCSKEQALVSWKHFILHAYFMLYRVFRLILQLWSEVGVVSKVCLLWSEIVVTIESAPSVHLVALREPVPTAEALLTIVLPIKAVLLLWFLTYLAATRDFPVCKYPHSFSSQQSSTRSL